ncbi:methylase [Tardibacter chloracetimidivorans]|uniref:Methylase n=1 Tax=Tardibacter chloracetimidivorans TaxID=1921510 RepID=A0A1L4A026_9SPHN|nr:methylase [Tardibacter chloracetimidivorans]
MFNPGPLGLFLNPFFLARRALWHEMARQGGTLAGPMLDVGCGTKPYRELFELEEYIGLEIDSPSARTQSRADYFYDGKKFPFEAEIFNSVLCNQVLEHVFNPDDFLQEIHRVLRQGGMLLLTVPFVWDEHEQPYDYARYSTFGLKSLLERNGFNVLTQKKLLADSSILFQLINAYLFKVFHTRSALVNRLTVALLIAPVSALGLVFGALLPKNDDLFLDQLILAKRC